MKLSRVAVASAALALALAVWVLVSGGPRDGHDGAARPDLELRPEVEVGPPANLVGGAVAVGGDARDGAVAEAPSADAPEARRAAPSAEEATLESPAQPVPARGGRSAEVVHRLRVLVRAEGGLGRRAEGDAGVTIRVDDELLTGRTSLFQTLEVELLRPARRRLPRAAVVLVDHPAYPPLVAELDLGRPRTLGRDDEGRTIQGYDLIATLQRGAAVLVGHTQGADHVALAEHHPSRRPGPLVLHDVASAAAGEYRLRVPRIGDWVILAWRDSAHPVFAVVTVPSARGEAGARLAQRALTVARTLSPVETELVVQGSYPLGFDPAGTEVMLLADRDSSSGSWSVGASVPMRELVDAWSKGGFAGQAPYFTWHRTTAELPTGEPFGYDLRDGRDEPERRDSIARLDVRATFDGDGLASVAGGPTGAALLLVRDPFRPELWWHAPVGDLAAVDRAPALLPVARLDVRGLGPEGPLAHGSASVALGRTSEPDEVAREMAREMLGTDPIAQTSLDDGGAGVLFVPARVPLVVEVSGAGGAPSASEVVSPAALGGVRAVTVTATAAASSLPTGG